MVRFCEQKTTRDSNPLNGKIFPIEHIGRKLQGTVVALNIFQKTSSNDALASRALVDFISEAISQTEFLRNYFEDASSTGREYTYAVTRS